MNSPAPGASTRDRAISAKSYSRITAADFVALPAGVEVRTMTCDHADHGYILKGGGGASDLELPTCCGDGDTCGVDMNNTCE